MQQSAADHGLSRLLHSRPRVMVKTRICCPGSWRRIWRAEHLRFLRIHQEDIEATARRYPCRISSSSAAVNQFSKNSSLPAPPLRSQRSSAVSRRACRETLAPDAKSTFAFFFFVSFSRTFLAVWTTLSRRCWVFSSPKVLGVSDAQAVTLGLSLCVHCGSHARRVHGVEKQLPERVHVYDVVEFGPGGKKPAKSFCPLFVGTQECQPATGSP